jgi:putative membrane protein
MRTWNRLLAVEHSKLNSMKLIGNLISAILGMTLVGTGFIVATPRANGAPTVSTAGKDFIQAAIQAGMTEVRLGEMANLKGNRHEVREFGHLIVREGATFNDDLKALAQQKGLTLPESLEAKHQAIVDKMTNLTGSRFDDAFIAAATKELTDLAKEFRAESVATKDTDIKSVVDKSILVVNEHLKRITVMK